MKAAMAPPGCRPLPDEYLSGYFTDRFGSILMAGMRVWVIVVSLALTGCSFVFVAGPSQSGPAHVYPRCDEGRAVPVIDAAFSALYVVGAITAGLGIDFLNEDQYTKGELIAVDSALAGIFAAAAYYGFTKTSACRRVRAEHNAKFGGPSPAPGP